MAKSTGPTRPLSPHLQVWKFHPTMLSSILHRASGMVNYVGVVLVAIWLIALASGEAAYVGLMDFLNGPIKILVLLALAGFTLSLVYHLLNGFRHLVWDLGKGFDPVGSNQRSLLIMTTSVVLTAVIWLLGLGVFAVALLILVPIFTWSLAKYGFADYESARAWVGSPLGAIVTLLTLTAAFYHMRLGLQVVIEDYIHKAGPKIVLLLANTLLAAGLWLATLYAVLSVAT